jgi:hypothetical protein
MLRDVTDNVISGMDLSDVLLQVEKVAPVDGCDGCDGCDAQHRHGTRR